MFAPEGAGPGNSESYSKQRGNGGQAKRDRRAFQKQTEILDQLSEIELVAYDRIRVPAAAE